MLNEFNLKVKNSEVELNTQHRLFSNYFCIAVRLIGFVHFRGLLLQGRLASENGFLLGSLKGGRFIENENWETFGIRMQDCDPRGSSWQDSVTHIDDSQKFIVQLEWTTEKDIGAVQFT